MASRTDSFKGFKKGYKAIFTLPGTGVIYLLVISVLLADAVVGLIIKVDIAAFLTATLIALMVSHLPLFCNRRIFTLKRVAGLSLFILIIEQPVIFMGSAVEASLTALIVVSVVCATLYSRKTGLMLLASTLFTSWLGGVTDIVVTATAVALISVYLYKIDSRIRVAAGVSGLEFLNSFFHYILGGYKEKLEKYLEKISDERVLNLHVYSFINESGERVADAVISEIHPGPFRRVGSSELPQRLMRRTIPTLFLKAPASHGENLASSRYIEDMLETLNTIEPHVNEDAATIAQIEGSLLDTFSLKFLSEIPPLVLCDPQVPLEDLPRSIIEDTPELVVADLHSLIASEYDVVAPGTIMYTEVLSQTYAAAAAEGCSGEIKAAALHIDYSDGLEVAEGGITLLALAVGGYSILVVSIDGNNMDPYLKAEARKALKKYFTHVLLATTDTHVYSGAFTRVEYLPVGTRRRDELIGLLTRTAPLLISQMKPVRIGYFTIPVKAKFVSKEKLGKISIETEKNLRDGIKIMAIMLLYPLLLLLLKNTGDFLPLFVNHLLYLLYVSFG